MKRKRLKKLREQPFEVGVYDGYYYPDLDLYVIHAEKVEHQPAKVVLSGEDLTMLLLKTKG